MVERISRPSGPSDKERKKFPDTERFQKEIESIEKISEPELDKQKKKLFKSPEEKEEEAQEPTPYEPSFYERAKQGLKGEEEKEPSPPSYEQPEVGEEEDLPSSPSFYQKVDLHEATLSTKPEEPSSLAKKEEKEKEKLGVAAEKKEEKLPSVPFFAKKEKREDFEKKPSLLSKEEAEKMLERLPLEEKKEMGKVAPWAKEEKKEGKKIPPALPEKKEEKLGKAPFFVPREKRKEEQKEPLVESLATKTKEEKIKRKEEAKERSLEAKKEAYPELKETPMITKELPADIQTQASAAASAAQPYLKPENLPLFERMVGTILQMTKEGIEKNEVLLTSPAFVGSKYYGTRIIFEKYATAPDSFNIHLTGSDEAVTIFNNNLEGLIRAFDNGDFSFRIGRLWAEYETERPLFRRKPAIGEESREGKKEQ